MKINLQSGYALLFTMVILSIVSAIAMGVSSTMYKSSILSSTAKDSEMAFYQADTAVECGIYMAEFEGLANIGNTFDCGIDQNGNSMVLTKDSPQNNQYTFEPSSFTNGPCFKIFIDKSNSSLSVIEGRGYNTCNTLDPKLLERGLKIEY